MENATTDLQTYLKTHFSETSLYFNPQFSIFTLTFFPVTPTYAFMPKKHGKYNTLQRNVVIYHFFYYDMGSPNKLMDYERPVK